MSSACDFAFNSNREGGSDSFASWATIPYPGSQPYSMPHTCDSEAEGTVGGCAMQCCAYCLADKNCVQARLIGTGCHLVHKDPKLPFAPWNNKTSKGITTILPRHL